MKTTSTEKKGSLDWVKNFSIFAPRIKDGQVSYEQSDEFVPGAVLIRSDDPLFNDCTAIQLREKNWVSKLFSDPRSSLDLSSFFAFLKKSLGNVS